MWPRLMVRRARHNPAQDGAARRTGRDTWRGSRCPSAAWHARRGEVDQLGDKIGIAAVRLHGKGHPDLTGIVSSPVMAPRSKSGRNRAISAPRAGRGARRRSAYCAHPRSRLAGADHNDSDAPVHPAHQHRDYRHRADRAVAASPSGAAYFEMKALVPDDADRFARDSPLEEGGLELPVPLRETRSS